jgi:hypothetical protein
MHPKTSRQHDGTRFYAGGAEVSEEVFWEHVRLAAAISVYDHGAYTVRLTPKGIGAATRLLLERERLGLGRGRQAGR